MGPDTSVSHDHPTHKKAGPDQASEAVTNNEHRDSRPEQDEEQHETAKRKDTRDHINGCHRYGTNRVRRIPVHPPQLHTVGR
jgi:hypothetical protein